MISQNPVLQSLLFPDPSSVSPSPILGAVSLSENSFLVYREDGEIAVQEFNGDERHLLYF